MTSLIFKECYFPTGEGFCGQSAFAALFGSIPSMYTYDNVPGITYIDVEQFKQFIKNESSLPQPDDILENESYAGEDGSKLCMPSQFFRESREASSECRTNSPNRTSVLALIFKTPTTRLIFKVIFTFGANASVSLCGLYDSDGGKAVLTDYVSLFATPEKFPEWAFCESKKMKNINIVSTTQYGGLELRNYPIQDSSEISIEENYNDSFVPEAKKIESFIKNDKSGIVILHGEKGTGKTTYIRKLISEIDKKFIYIPKELFVEFASPQFSAFLTTLRNSVIIIEDAESVLCRNDEGQRSPLISAILNYTDGLMGDIFHFKFICTCNEDLADIDEAILRKGRIFGKYEFNKLDTSKANALLAKLGKKSDAKEPMSLADIYYYDDTDYSDEKSTKSPVGFTV